jgi:hypothetical protein
MKPIPVFFMRQPLDVGGDYIDLVTTFGKFATNILSNAAPSSSNRREFMNEYKNPHHIDR